MSRVLLLLLLSSVAFGQTTGIIHDSRVIDWSGAGVTIPARVTQCGSPIPAYAGSASTINSAIAACTSGQHVKLGPGTFTLTSGIDFANKSSVTLRGSGADSTFLVFSGSVSCFGLATDICLRNGELNYQAGPVHTANWTAGFTKATTTITLSSVTGLATGSLIVLDQLADASDSGDIYQCDTDNVCADDVVSGSARTGRPQQQIVRVTGIAGSDVTFTPGLYMPNWRIGQTPGAWWGDTVITQVGIEDLSIDHTASDSQGGVVMMNCDRCWVKGVTSIGADRNHVWFYIASHPVIRDSYFYNTRNSSSQSYGGEGYLSSDALIENNIFHKITGPLMANGPSVGMVRAYNYSIDDQYSGSASWMMGSNWLHAAGTEMMLDEGNIGPGYTSDNIHGTHHLNTLFRNYFAGWETGKTSQTVPIHLYTHSRFFNVIGNVLGRTSYHNHYESLAPSGTNGDTSIYTLGWSGNGGTTNGACCADDTTTASSLMRWGNWDAVNAAVRWDNTESSPGAGGSYISAQTTPVSHTLPASFYLASQPAFWPTPFGTPAYPAIGPDVTGGNISGVGGFANKIPAQLCYENTSSSGGILNFDPAACYYAAGTPPTDVYVAQSSAGANNGTSCANARAKSTLIAGDEGPDVSVHICDTLTGTAGQTALSCLASGTSGHLLKFVFESGARMGNSAYWGGTSAGAITCSNQSYVEIDGGTNGLIDNLANGSGLANQAVSTGVYLNNCQHCTVKNLTVASMYRHTQDYDNNANALLTAGIKVNASSDVLIDNNQIYDAGFGIRHIWANSDANVTITNNKIQFSNRGIEASGAGTITGQNYSGNDISDAINWFYGTTGGTWTTTYLSAGIHIAATGASQVSSGPVISGNYIHGHMGAFLNSLAAPRPSSEVAHIWVEQSGSGSITSPKIFNNRLIGASLYHRPENYISVSATTSQVVNNTVLGADAAPGYVVNSACFYFTGTGNFQNNICKGMRTGINKASGTLTSNNNVFNGLSSATMVSGATTYASLAAWVTATSQDGSSSTADPLTDSVNSLKTGSSAINLGADLTGLGITALDTDYLGAARPSGSAWEAGAYEYSGNSVDFAVARSAGTTVIYQGYDGYTLHSVAYSGATTWVYFMNTSGPASALSITGLPTGLTATVKCMSGIQTVLTACYGSSFPFYQYNTSTNPIYFSLRIQASGGLAPGDYVIPVQTRVGTVTRTTYFPIRVEATPSLPAPGTYSSTPIPGKANWESKMTTYGALWCQAGGVTNPATLSFGVESQIWYYDGARGYFQTADYTGVSNWQACALNIANQYADYVIAGSNGAGVPAYRVFTNGLRMAYERTGTAKFKTAILDLANNSPYASNAGGNSPTHARETAYALSAYINAERVGAPHNPKAELAVSYLLATFDGIFARHNYPILIAAYDHVPFWDGLMAESLIEYYDHITPDPRIPVAIKQVLDWWRLAGWNNIVHTFPYDMNSGTGGSDQRLLINLMVPAYAWYYKLTQNSDTNYLTWGDDIWNHSLDLNPNFTGKEWSQNWKWSFDYVADRTLPAPADLSLNPASHDFGAQLATTTSSAFAYTLHNSGGTTVNLGTISENSAHFAISANTCTSTLAPSATCLISVTFTPTSAGLKTGTLTVPSDAPGNPHTAVLQGTGTADAIVTLAPLSLAFGTRLNGSTTLLSILLTNSGGSTLTITSIGLAGTDSGQFLEDHTGCGATLAAAASCSISVFFKPTLTGSKSAQVSIVDSASGSPHTVPLTGTGQDLLPPIGLGVQVAGAEVEGAEVE